MAAPSIGDTYLGDALDAMAKGDWSRFTSKTLDQINEMVIGFPKKIWSTAERESFWEPYIANESAPFDRLTRELLSAPLRILLSTKKEDDVSKAQAEIVLKLEPSLAPLYALWWTILFRDALHDQTKVDAKQPERVINAFAALSKKMANSEPITPLKQASPPSTDHAPPPNTSEPTANPTGTTLSTATSSSETSQARNTESTLPVSAATTEIPASKLSTTAHKSPTSPTLLSFDGPYASHGKTRFGETEPVRPSKYSHIATSSNFRSVEETRDLFDNAIQELVEDEEWRVEEAFYDAVCQKLHIDKVNVTRLSADSIRTLTNRLLSFGTAPASMVSTPVERAISHDTKNIITLGATLTDAQAIDSTHKIIASTPAPNVEGFFRYSRVFSSASLALPAMKVGSRSSEKLTDLVSALNERKYFFNFQTRQLGVVKASAMPQIQISTNDAHATLKDLGNAYQSALTNHIEPSTFATVMTNAISSEMVESLCNVLGDIIREDGYLICEAYVVRLFANHGAAKIFPSSVTLASIPTYNGHTSKDSWADNASIAIAKLPSHLRENGLTKCLGVHYDVFVSSTFYTENALGQLKFDNAKEVETLRKALLGWHKRNVTVYNDLVIAGVIDTHASGHKAQHSTQNAQGQQRNFKPRQTDAPASEQSTSNAQASSSRPPLPPTQRIPIGATRNNPDVPARCDFCKIDHVAGEHTDRAAFARWFNELAHNVEKIGNGWSPATASHPYLRKTRPQDSNASNNTGRPSNGGARASKN